MEVEVEGGGGRKCEVWPVRGNWSRRRCENARIRQIVLMHETAGLQQIRQKVYA